MRSQGWVLAPPGAVVALVDSSISPLSTSPPRKQGKLGRRSQSEGLAGSVSGEGVFLFSWLAEAAVWPGEHMTSTAHARAERRSELSDVSFYKDTNPMSSGPRLTTSLT